MRLKGNGRLNIIHMYFFWPIWFFLRPFTGDLCVLISPPLFSLTPQISHSFISLINPEAKRGIAIWDGGLKDQAFLEKEKSCALAMMRCDVWIRSFMDRWRQTRDMARAVGDRGPRNKQHNDYTITHPPLHPPSSSPFTHLPFLLSP